MTCPEHVLYAYSLNDGHARSLEWKEVLSWQPDKGPIWIHLDRVANESQAWLRNDVKLDSNIVECLLASGTRPRFEAGDKGLFLTLRGVDLNPGADPSEMISIRIWVEPNRLITLEREHLLSVSAVAEQFKNGCGPASIGELLVTIISGLTERIGSVIDDIDELMDDIEDHIVDPEREADRSELIRIRQKAIKLHRYIKPQSQAIFDLYAAKFESIDTKQQQLLKETINRVTRYVEDIDSIKSRAAVVQDELANQIAQHTNQRMYTMTIIAAIFLPLTFGAGMLGINVGGIPGSTYPHGFLVVSIIFMIIGIIEFFIARYCKWL